MPRRVSLERDGRRAGRQVQHVVSYTARRTFVAVVVVSLQFSIPPVDAQTSPTIHLLVVPLETDATAYYAADLGLYTKYGLNVDVQVAPTGAAIAAAITGGSAEIGYANLISIAQAVESGIPFGVVLPCSTYSSKARPTTLLIVDKNGGDSKSVHWLDMTPAEEPAALAQARVAAISVTEPMASMSLAQGGRILANEFAAIAPAIRHRRLVHVTPVGRRASGFGHQTSACAQRSRRVGERAPGKNRASYSSSS